MTPCFYEFFCGGGMVRAGLEPEWRCLFANDLDARKGAVYATNWGASELRIADVASLAASDLPGRPDLAWASFPCQDLSLAGAGAGLDGARSSAFWGFCSAIRALKADGRAPPLVALENVAGILTSKRGSDFAAVCAALQGLGYRFGALTIDAAHFVPQSRPRVFFVALRRDLSPSARLIAPGPPANHASPTLQRAVAVLPPPLARDWLWWRAPEPPRANLSLADCLDQEDGETRWRSAEETKRLVAALSPASRRDVALARASGARTVGALFRRTRPDGSGGARVQAEARFDGLAGCLRTPGGGSSRQFLIVIEAAETRSRLLTPRESARLMGLPENYRLPARATDAFHLVGDGVAPPVVRFLSRNLLLPLAALESEAARPLSA
jgi:DNA (cytosine-5)-methyltransferase 1